MLSLRYQALLGLGLAMIVSYLVLVSLFSSKHIPSLYLLVPPESQSHNQTLLDKNPSVPTPLHPPAIKPFNYSEIPFEFDTGQNRTAFFDVLSMDVMQRAWVWNATCDNFGLALPFCRFLRRLGTGHCVSIYAIGGSTTVGTIASMTLAPQRALWYAKLETWMNARFPCGGGGHKVYAHALSGGGSSTHLGSIPTIATKVKPLGNIDLFMLELGANDLNGVDDGPFTEALVYSLVALQPHAAIMIVTTAAPLEYHLATLSSRYQELPESKNHLPISLHLNLPLLSIPHAVMSSPARGGNTSLNLHTEGATDPSSPLFRSGRTCGSKCMLYHDGIHLSPVGHSLFASTIAMFWLAMIPLVEGVPLPPASPTDVVALTQAALFPKAKGLTETRTPFMAQSFVESSLPRGFELPFGWQFVNERQRFGIAAFGVCGNESHPQLQQPTTEAYMDPCSKPLTIDVGSSTVILNLLRSYRDMGIAIVKAPSHLLFDHCEFPLKVPQSSCVIDGIFGEKVVFWPVSLPWHVKLHLIPKDNTTNITNNITNNINNTNTTNTATAASLLPFNLSLHIASPALAANLTPTNSSFWNGTSERVLQSPLRGLQKTKILGWYSLN